MSEPRVLTAYAETAGGQGWVNFPVWVVCEATDGTERRWVECIQPDEQTDAIRTLYAVSQTAHLAMVREARKVLAKRKGRKG